MMRKAPAVTYDHILDSSSLKGLAGTSAEHDADQESNSSSLQVNNNSEITGICNEYGGSLKSETGYYYKCTMYHDFDICVTSRNDGAHKYHAGQLQYFSGPLHPENGYCNACALQFNLNRTSFQVYHCTVCEDYALCFRCRKEGKHYQHIEDLEKVFLPYYLDYIK